ncbi:hypothetical protein Z947_2616 [Sulfitobacter geojensis]|jgi:hypothetical protein|nr:hypothetical protein Z947_2616 [Sulfitobacter geojensis]
MHNISGVAFIAAVYPRGAAGRKQDTAIYSGTAKVSAAQ